MKIARFALSAVVLAAASVGAHADLVTNGNFETYGGPFSSDYSTVQAGSNALVGWTVGGTSIDVINGAYGAINGNSIDMLGTPGPGSLSQTLNTVAGQNYLLTFDLSANGGDTGPDKALQLGITGTSGASYAATDSVTHQSFAFTASSAQTVLQFSALDHSNSGPVLDNVSVAAVPEPESYAMLLAGLGLMGAIAKRRKAKQA